MGSGTILKKNNQMVQSVPIRILTPKFIFTSAFLCYFPFLFSSFRKSKLPKRILASFQGHILLTGGEENCIIKFNEIVHLSG